VSAPFQLCRFNMLGWFFFGADMNIRSSSTLGAGFAVTAGLLIFFLLDLKSVFPLNGSTATTESSCNFGMVKGDARQSCAVPVLQGCTVANFPGTSRPWSNISKGGLTTCRFNEKETDWKTRITGTCERCTTDQCSARFGVMFDCSSNRTPPASQ
jgi:hypothetical protein